MGITAGGLRRRGAARAAWIVAAVLLVPFLMGVAPARAAEPDPALGLTVTSGYGGRTGGGGWLPVEIVLAPARAVRGTLTVRVNTNSGPVAAQREVEVAPGSPKAYRFLLPFGVPIIRFDEAGAEPVELREPIVSGTDSYLVGMLGPVPVDAPPLRAEPAGLPGAWVSVDPAWLELSPSALAPLGTLVAAQDDLAALSPTAAANLAAGVVTGTDLVVHGPGGVDVGGITVPQLADGGATAWTLRAGDVAAGGGETVIARAAPAGTARVVATSVAPGEGELGRSSTLWSQLAQPSRPAAPDHAPWGTDQLGFQIGRLLTDSSGSGVPALPWLAVFVLAYVVVAGPLNAVLLGRMRRRELAWVTVPLITLVFTASAFASVSGARPPVGLAASTMSWLDGVGTETAVVAARAPGDASHEIALPGTDWAVRPLSQGGRPATVAHDGEATVVRFDLAPLQLGGVLARRTTDAAPPLDVRAVARGEHLEVEVTNRTGTLLESVAVRAATASRRIGRLAPGETGRVAFEGTQLPVMPAYRDVFDGLASGPPESMEAVLRADVLDGAPGVVWVVTALPGDPPADIRVDGAAPQSQGVLAAVGVRPERADSGLNPFAVRRDLVGPVALGAGPLAIDGSGEAVLRFRLPPGPLPAALRPDLERSIMEHGPDDRAWVWDWAARQWLDSGEAFAGGTGDPARLVSPLGEVWVRLSSEMRPLDFSARALWAPGDEA